MNSMRYGRILIVPGFCEPRWLMLPLRRALRPCSSTVEIWQDRIVARSLERSVKRLRDTIENADESGPIAIVTHSFGDWVVRQAIADSTQHRVETLVSVAPVIAASPLAQALYAIGGGCVSEVPVMADGDRAARNKTLDPSIRRLVIWASVDYWVRRVEFPVMENVDVLRRMATHLSVVVQPGVQHQIRDFLMRNPIDGAVA